MSCYNFRRFLAFYEGHMLIKRTYVLENSLELIQKEHDNFYKA
jgi:hypothetical protein